MTSKYSIDNRELLQRISSGEAVVGIDFGNLIIRDLAAFRLAAMDSESGYLPLDYLQGHKDGLEWASQLAEANHPDTGDWLYDDPIELAKAIRKGPDMPPVQPVADSEPVIVVGDDGGDALSYRRLIQSFEPGTKLYRHAQPAPAVPGKWIPVSERMPEVGEIVLAAMGGAVIVSETECSAANYRFFTSVISGRELPATHWMPLPAAPQEVKP
ncbi:Eaa1 [Klebsiella pneumoniae]|uniref:DUF551 domain-containing protein n=1 Tax=Klebsiella pneumoniae TaxID=573 RepID=UPI000E2AC658|nr:DUF551 domain-containing protein [Klebsiella pneumoniae]SWG09720.1 Eaa1 [Klebsiella pneumoniae]